MKVCKYANILGPNIFDPKRLPGQNFFKPSVPGGFRIFRAFASLFFSILYALKLVLTSSFLYDFSSKVTNREAVDRSRNLTKPSHNISSFVQYFLFSPILNNSIQFVSILIILYLSGWIIFGLDWFLSILCFWFKEFNVINLPGPFMVCCFMTPNNPWNTTLYFLIVFLISNFAFCILSCIILWHIIMVRFNYSWSQ